MSLIWLGGPLSTACEEMLKPWDDSLTGASEPSGNCNYLMILVTTALRISEVAGPPGR